jgi:hypothetical protein
MRTLLQGYAQLGVFFLQLQSGLSVDDLKLTTTITCAE